MEQQTLVVVAEVDLEVAVHREMVQLVKAVQV